MRFVKITYIGKRIVGDKVLQAFLDHNGKQVHFAGVKFVSIGTLYRAQPKAKDGLSVARIPLDMGQAPESEQTVEAWRIEDRLASEFQYRKRASSKAAKSEVVKRCADILRPFAKDFTTAQLRELLEMIVDEATKEIREEQTRRLNAQLSKALKRIKGKSK